MPRNFKKLVRYAIFGVFALSFAWVSSQLFFEKQTGHLLASVGVFFGNESRQQVPRDLTVMYASFPVSMDPTVNDQTARQRLINMYEPLVGLDRDLNPKPVLALSWGQIDDLTWSFTLRPDVNFHDGSSFDADDVVASLDRAMNLKTSALKGVLQSIEKIEIIDDATVHIRTHKPDPLLLQRLSLILIFPSELSDKDNLRGIGTGPYKFRKFTDEKTIILEGSAGYWGEKPKFGTVTLKVGTDKSDRVNTFLSGEADVLEFVPPDAVNEIKKRGFQLVSIPGLEVNFLIFNTNSDILKEVKNRQAVSLAIDQEALVKALGFNTHSVNQFVSNGVFGFNPYISAHEYDLKKAEELVTKTGLKGQTLSFHVALGLEVLGEHVRTQLAKIDVNAVISYMNQEDLMKSLQTSKADIYFFGFKSDVGDSADFLDTMVRSGGSFNFLKYSNKNLDGLIGKGLTELKPSVRVKSLQEAMRVLMEDEVIGVPLFEYELYYAFDGKVDFQPRIDGFLSFDELIIK